MCVHRVEHVSQNCLGVTACISGSRFLCFGRRYILVADMGRTPPLEMLEFMYERRGFNFRVGCIFSGVYSISQFLSTRRMSTNTKHRIAPHRTAPHRIASHRIASHRIASHHKL